MDQITDETEKERQRVYLEKLYDQVGALISKTDDPEELARITVRLKKIRANINKHPIKS